MYPIHFVERGIGKPIILLHGFCETHEIFNEFSISLANDYRIIIPDLPGFGNSPLTKEFFTLHDISKTMCDWLDAIHIDSCILIGHSLGGYITLDMANFQPNRFEGIGLFHSTANSDTPEKKAGRDAVNDFVERNGVEAFTKTFVPGLFFNPDHEAVRPVNEIAKLTKARSIIGHNLAMKGRPAHLDFLSNSEKPILIIAGEHDSIIPIATLHEQSRLNAMIQFNALPETGHMGMYECANRASQIIKDFADLCYLERP